NPGTFVAPRRDDAAQAFAASGELGSSALCPRAGRRIYRRRSPAPGDPSGFGRAAAPGGHGRFRDRALGIEVITLRAGTNRVARPRAQPRPGREATRSRAMRV